MQELVQQGENDVMVNYATPTIERYRDFQLTVPYGYEGFSVTLKVPPPLPRWQNLLYPFSWQSLLSNPLENVPEGWRIRYFLLAWWIASWILSMSYMCNLIAILTVPVFPTKLQTLREVADSKYRVCMLDYGEFVPGAMAASTQPVLLALAARIDMVPVLDHMPEMGSEGCVERVLDDSHVHIEAYLYATTLYILLGLNSEIYALTERIYPSYIVMLINKHAPWKYKFDIGMERFREGGLIQKWYQDAMAEFTGKSGKISSSSTLDLKPLSLGHLQGSFLLLLLGNLGGFVAMVGEVLLPSRSKNNNGNTTSISSAF